MIDDFLRGATQGAYDLQKIRISTGNRLAQAYYQAHGVTPGERPEDAMEEADLKIVDAIRADYKRLTDGLVALPRKATFEPTSYISSYAVMVMASAYEQTLKAEATAFKALNHILADVPIWTEYLQHVRGCGPAMAAVMVSRLDPHRAPRPSNFWAYAGFDVARDGRGRNRRKDHLVDREYRNRGGEVSVRKSITFDPWLKTKMYVLGTCFLKAGGKYKDIYDGYKHRLEHMPPLAEQRASSNRPVLSTVDWANTTKGHRHNAAMRYMIKIFLLDLWKEWRALEGLPVVGSYGEVKLGLNHAA